MLYRVYRPHIISGKKKLVGGSSKKSPFGKGIGKRIRKELKYN